MNTLDISDVFFKKVYCFNKKQKIKRTDRERIKKEMYIHMSDKRGNERKKTERERDRDRIERKKQEQQHWYIHHISCFGRGARRKTLLKPVGQIL